MKKTIVLLVTVIILVSSCSKSKIEAAVSTGGNTNPSGSVTEAGYGSSNQPFNTAVWQLPAGIQLEDSIHEYSYCWAFPPFVQVAQKDWKGVPLGFTFCLTLKNSSTKPVTIQFPPQLIFASSSAMHQNVLTMDIGSVEMPGGAIKTIVVQGFCINLGRHIPTTFDDGTDHFLTYSFGPSSIPTALQEVVDIIGAKHITMNDILKADGTIDNAKAVKYSIIQTAIWEVTDRQGLTNTTRQQLSAL